MLVNIESSKKIIDIESLKCIGSGQDGDLFRYGDIVIKINNSDYMTHEKFEDLIKAIKKSQEKGIDISKSMLVLPEKKVEATFTPVKRLRITPLFGYTQRYVLEDKKAISIMTTAEFIEGTSIIHDNVHQVFTPNLIAIIDTNPQNLLITPDKKIYFIDFDRNITKSCMISEKDEVKDNDYYKHNERRFAQIVNKFLLLYAYTYIRENYKREKRVADSIVEEAFATPSLDQLYSYISHYSTLKEYAEDKACELIKRKK